MSGALPIVTPCRSCKARIRWAQLPDGKRIPLDAEPLTHTGEYTVALEYIPARVDPSGRAVDGEQRWVARPVETLLTHFATCPDAKKWRKDGE